MAVNFNNLDGYEALEEILTWKRHKRRSVKSLNENFKERYLKNLFYKIKVYKNGKSN